MTNVRAAAIYARISSDVAGSGMGVQRQLEDCRKLSDSLGWQVGEEYQDNDLSAYSGKRRPGYERMLADLRDGERDAVIVYHVDRLTRRPIELEQFLLAIDTAKVRHVRFVVGDNDLSTGDGLMVVRILAAMAANESATKSRRVKRKLEANAAAGLPHGGALRPFGYDQTRMTVIESEAVIIRQLAERFLAGKERLAARSPIEQRIANAARRCGKLTVVAEPVEQLITAGVLHRLDTRELADHLAGRTAQDEAPLTSSGEKPCGVGMSGPQLSGHLDARQ